MVAALGPLVGEKMVLEIASEVVLYLLENWWITGIGVLLGLLVGFIPGFGATNAYIVLFPVTLHMKTIPALLFIVWLKISVFIVLSLANDDNAFFAFKTLCLDMHNINT